MVMDSLLGSPTEPYNPEAQQEEEDRQRQQLLQAQAPAPPPPPQANPNTGDVPFAAGQTPPVYGPPVPPQVDNGGINPNQGGFRGPENPANVTPGGQYAPNPDLGILTPFHPLNEAVFGPQGIATPYLDPAREALGNFGQQLGGAIEGPFRPFSPGGPGGGGFTPQPGPLAQAGGMAGSSLIPNSIEQFGLNALMAPEGAGLLERATGIPFNLESLRNAGSAVRDFSMPEPSLYPGLSAGVPPIHPSGGEMAFGPFTRGAAPTDEAVLAAQHEAALNNSYPWGPAAPPEAIPGLSGNQVTSPDYAPQLSQRMEPPVTQAPPSPADAGGALEQRVREIQAAQNAPTGEGQVVRLAVNPDAVAPLDPNTLMGSRGAVELTNPSGARILGPGEQPDPGEILLHHGAGDAGIQGELRPGMNLTPDPGDAQVFARTASRLEGGGLPEASSSVSPPPPSPDGKLPTPAELAGVSHLEGDARAQAMNDAAETAHPPSIGQQDVQEWINSPSGRAATAQRDALINTGLRPGETTTAATGGVPPTRTTGGGATGGGGGGVPPTGPAPQGINPNLWQQGMSAISAPTRVLLGFFPHSLRIGVQEIPTHAGAFANAVKGMAEIYRTGKAPLADAVNHSFTGTNGILQNKGVLLSDMEAKFHPTATQYVNPTLAEKGLSLIPGLDRASKANFGYLNLFRDGIYNQAADFLARTTPNADKAMFEDLYLRASHGTGHSTLPGLRGNSTLGAAGLGPSALAARLQNTLDIFIGSGAPTPFSAGARGEAMRSLMGTAGVMALTSAVGYKLGAEVNLPFNLGPIKATDITNQNGIDSKLFKAVSTTPDLANKTVYGGGGGYDTLFRFFANVGIDAMNGDHKALEGHVTSFLRGQAGVVPSIALDLLLGKNWHDDPYGPRGGDKGMENFKGDLGQGFVNHWGPIAVKSLVDAYNAWGPGGLVRAAPSLGAYEVTTSNTTTTDQRNAVKDDARVPEPIRGVNPTELGPRGDKALDAVVKQQQPDAYNQAVKDQKDNGNPVFTKYHETIDAANAQADQRKTDLYNALRDGKLNGEQLRAGREIINGIANNKRDGARNDPEYKDAISQLEQNDVNKALSGYYKIGDMFKTPDGKPDWDKIDQAQGEFVKFIEQNKPQIAGPFKFEITPQNKTNPLDQLYQAAQPMLARYGAIKDDYARSQAQRNNPKEDAFLALLGYGKTQSPQAAQILEQLRANLPGAAAPVGARGQGVAAPAEAAPPPAQAQAPPPQAAAPPAPTGATLPPVVANDTQQRQNFVNAMSGPAHAYAQTTGIPPAVWAAMGASESNWGRAQSIFGIMGKGTAGGQNYDTFEIRPGGVRENTNSQFAAYNNLDDAFKHFVDLTSTGRYAPAHDYLMQTGDWQGFLHQINQAGYATAPNWADSIISLTHHIEQTYPGVR